MNEISVVIPTYNEARRLKPTLSEVDNYLDENFKSSEIIISDSASTDKTLEVVKNYNNKCPLKVVTSEKREGKGDGVKRGVLAASKEWVLFMDADNSTPISEIERFKVHLDDNDIVIGSRYLDNTILKKQNIFRRAVSRMGNGLVKVVTGLNYKDTQCGFKLFRINAAKKVFSKLVSKGWGFDVEILMLAEKFSLKVKEVPVEWRDAEGSHLRVGQDSIKTFTEVVKIVRRVKSL